VLNTMPMTSPIAHPVKQCRVAETASLQVSVMGHSYPLGDEWQAHITMTAQALGCSAGIGSSVAARGAPGQRHDRADRDAAHRSVTVGRGNADALR
jgi:hypothetical protein